VESLPNFLFYIQDKPNIAKYTFKLGNTNEHFTLSYVAKKKIFDLHKKDETIVETEVDDPYHNYFEMSSFKFFRLLRKLGLVQGYLFQELVLTRKINIGKLKKYNCWLVQLDNFNFSQDLYNVKRKGREIKLNKKFDLESAIGEINWLHPDEIHKIDCNVFEVFRYKKGILYSQGHIYKSKESNKLFFWSKRSFKLYTKLVMVSVHNLLAQISFQNKEQLLLLLRDIIEKNKT